MSVASVAKLIYSHSSEELIRLCPAVCTTLVQAPPPLSNLTSTVTATELNQLMCLYAELELGTEQKEMSI